MDSASNYSDSYKPQPCGSAPERRSRRIAGFTIKTRIFCSLSASRAASSLHNYFLEFMKANMEMAFEDYQTEKIREGKIKESNKN